MINRKGAIITAKELTIKEEPTEGFYQLVMHNRLDLTIEHFVIQDKYKELFSEEEIKRCYDRLVTYNYKF